MKVIITHIFANENEMEKPIRYRMTIDNKHVISGDHVTNHTLDRIMGFLQALDLLGIDVEIVVQQEILKLDPMMHSPFDICDGFVTDTDGITRKRRTIARK